MKIDRRLFAHFDWGLVGATLLVPFLGLFVLFSAGYDPEALNRGFQWVPTAFRSIPFLKQIMFIGAGIITMLVGVIIPGSFWYRYAFIIYGMGVSLLIAVSQFGVVVKGSRRWLDLGPINLQPAEFMKLGLILALAKYFSANIPPPGGFKLKQIIIPFGIFLLPMAFIMKQPDLGTALVCGGVGFLISLFVGINWKTLAMMLAVGIISVFPAWNFYLHDYQKNRIVALFDPEFDPKGSGYHIAQSKIAVGSGEVFGKGFLKGTQTQLEFLPEHTTDFIFSVLAEEWGFMGCIVVLLAYFFFLFRILRVVLKSKDVFSSLVSFGIASLIFFHAAVNMGMVVGMLPVVGIPLPLFSYGGSSVLSTMFGVGIVLGISMRRFAYLK